MNIFSSIINSIFNRKSKKDKEALKLIKCLIDSNFIWVRQIKKDAILGNEIAWYLYLNKDGIRYNFELFKDDAIEIYKEGLIDLDNDPRPYSGTHLIQLKIESPVYSGILENVDYYDIDILYYKVSGEINLRKSYLKNNDEEGLKLLNDILNNK